MARYVFQSNVPITFHHRNVKLTRGFSCFSIRCCFVSSNLDKAKDIAIAYVQKKNPNFKNIKVSSAKLIDGKWVVEIQWLISERTIAGTQNIRVTLTSNFDVIDYEETGFRGVAGG